MSMITRRNLMKTAAAGLTLPALARSGFAAEPLKVGFVYLGAIGDYGWTWSHEQGRKALDDALERSGRRRLCREREGGCERDSGDEGPRPAGPQAHLHHFLRLHGSDARSRQAVPGRQMGALHRLQARRQCRHLQFALLSGPRRHRHDRRHDVEDRHDRVCRVVQDPGSGDGRERLHPCGAGGQPEDHHQARHDRHLVRSGQGGRGGGDAGQSRLRRDRPARR